MAIKVKMERGIDFAGAIERDWGKSMPILAEEILGDTNEYTKFDEGYLTASSLIHSDFRNGKLVWQTPYARRQYWEIKTAYTDVHPKATWRWFEAAKAANMPKWQRQIQRLMEMNI